MRIVFASGKGGAGKTTVTASLAAKMINSTSHRICIKEPASKENGIRCTPFLFCFQ